MNADILACYENLMHEIFAQAVRDATSHKRQYTVYEHWEQKPCMMEAFGFLIRTLGKNHRITRRVRTMRLLGETMDARVTLGSAQRRAK